MLYKGYELIQSGTGVRVEGVRDFDPVHIFECGQCFRWYREPDGSYTGVVRGKAANVSYEPGVLTLDNVTAEDFMQVWFDYFDLGRDYGEIKKAVSVDPIMEKAVEFGGGIRLLRQEPWEALMSFIISANNRIPRIMSIILQLSKLFGDEIEYRGSKFYSFPDAGRLAACSLEQIGECRAGYRCEYIHTTAAEVAKNGYDHERLSGMETGEARKELLRFKGVGNKVADCALLYGGIKYDVFPVDVWVKRVMEELYFKREASFAEIQRFASEKFGRYAGFAQQYLFYYAREHRIGI
jgi:N-glycosylase/DNA lyase